MSGRRRPRAQKRAGKPRTLRTRLVVSTVTLIAVVCAVIGTVTTFALKQHLYDQLDQQLSEIAARAHGGFHPPDGGGNGTPPSGKNDGTVPVPDDTQPINLSKFVLQ